MEKIKKFDVYAAGLAIFAMFFGAGNIIYPLALGHYALDKTSYAIAGLLITAVGMPFTGLFAMFLYRGDIKGFFGRLGKIPGLLVAGLTIGLLGPFGSTPRCIALAYSTFQLSFTSLSPVLFSALSCLLIFLCAYKKNRLISLLGYVLTPGLVLLLTVIIIKGFLARPEIALSAIDQSQTILFWKGLKEGYNTMDLLAAFFFAPVILGSLQEKSSRETATNMTRFILKASLIGALLLSAIYIGFSFLASFYAPHIEDVPSEQLLAAIAIHILGPYAGLIVELTIALACLTTTIALIAAFTDFLHREIFKEKLSYKWLMIVSLVITFFIAIFEFKGISQFLGPILEICYPILIALTFINIFYHFYQARASNQARIQIQGSEA